jgi:hypothetical protein
MTVAAADRPAETGTQYRKAITAGVIGNVLEWYDFGVYGYLVPTISQLFFPSGDPVVSLLSTFAVFWRRFCDAAGRVDPVRHLRRPSRSP